MSLVSEEKNKFFFSRAGGLWIGREVKVIEQVLEITYKEFRDQDVAFVSVDLFPSWIDVKRISMLLLLILLFDCQG